MISLQNIWELGLVFKRDIDHTIGNGKIMVENLVMMLMHGLLKSQLGMDVGFLSKVTYMQMIVM